MVSEGLLLVSVGKATTADVVGSVATVWIRKLRMGGTARPVS